MRILIGLILVAAVAWSAYWVVGSRVVRSAIDDGIAALETRGIEVETEGIRVTGFPNRFDTMIDAPRVVWPGGTAWAAPFLQVFALSYRPNQIIAAFPEEQRIDTRLGEVALGTERARASALLRTGGAGVLDRANLVADGVRLGWQGREIAASRVLAAIRVPEGAEADRQNIGLTLDDVALPRAMAARLPQAARIVDGLTLDAFLDLSAPLSRQALEAGEIGVERIEIESLDLDWGGAALDAAGALDVGEDGRLSGSVEVTLSDWRRALEIAVAAGLLDAAQRRMAEQGFAALAAMSGRDDRLTTALDVRDGRIWLGPVPLGPAPRL